MASKKTAEPGPAPASHPQPITIFVSYSHKDVAACQKLRIHLAPLQRDGVEIWWDEEIVGGGELDPEIRRALRRSSIFVALVSPEYLASHYCFDIEYRYALGRARRKTMHVVAAIVRPSGWKHTRMAHYKALPKDGKAATKWTNRDQAYEDISDGIRRIVQRLREPVDKPAPARRAVAPSPGPKKPKAKVTSPRKPAKNKPLGRLTATKARARAQTGKPPPSRVRKPKLG
jgi:hypothetical protein